MNNQTGYVQSGAWDSNAPLWLRVNREGTVYQTSWSSDGAIWFSGPTMQYGGTPARGGLFVANGDGGQGEMHLVTDYLFDTAAPLPFEDAGLPDDNDPPYIYRWDSMALNDATARVRWWSDEATDGMLRYGFTSSYGGGTEFLGEPGWVNELLMTGLDPASTYQFQLTTDDQRGQTEVLTGSVTTSGLGGGQPAIRVWNGWNHPTLHMNYQVFGAVGNAQDRVNVVGRILDTDEDRVDLNDTLVWTFNDGPEHTALLGDPDWISGPGEAPWRLTDEGDYNIVLPVADLAGGPLVDGYHRNELRLVATDNDGHVGIETVYVLWKPNTSWPHNYSTNFEHSAMTDKEGPQFQVQTIDGDWFIDYDTEMGFAVRTTPKHLGYDRLFAGRSPGQQPLGQLRGADPGARDGSGPERLHPGHRFLRLRRGQPLERAPGRRSLRRAEARSVPLSSLWTYRWWDASGSNANWQLWVNENQGISNVAGPAVTLGDSYWMKIRVQSQSNGSTNHDIKVWRRNEVEPAAWMHSVNTPPAAA
ncbi:MAG: hypothetical protein R3F17_03645 [Planctomycetota bacterium]